MTVGSFQALQHRMIEVVISIEHARPMSHLARAIVDTRADPLERLVALDPDTAFDLPSKAEGATHLAA